MMMDFQADRIEHGHPRCGPNWWFALLLFGLMMGSPMLWGQDRILGDPSIDASETAMRGSQRNVNFFESKIRPLLAKHCYECHSEPAGKMEAGLRVDTAAGLRRGGAGGPAVVPGKPSQSRLMQSVRYDDPTLRMPPEEHGGKLSDEAIATLEKWILAGAFDPRGPTAWEEPTPATDWWAFQPLPANRPTPPQVENSSWCYDPIDQFIASAHRNKGLMPVADAAPETLMRRVALDLTG
ncbi:MAG: c-type cytochrome domain-containing protein, partial [Pirellulaceae bacterium]